MAAGVDVLSTAGVNVSVYNLPLCVLDLSVRPFSVQSISDRIWRAPLTGLENRSPRLSQYQPTKGVFAQFNGDFETEQVRFGLCAGYRSGRSCGLQLMADSLSPLVTNIRPVEGDAAREQLGGRPSPPSPRASQAR